MTAGDGDVTLCVGLVVIGGLRRIAKVSMVVVPFMAIAYTLVCLLVMFANCEKIPGAVCLVVKAAFNPAAVTGAPCFLMVALAFFAFTTILGWDYYSERCLEYIVGARRQWAVKTYRLLYVLVVFVGPYLTVSVVWDAADVFNGLMAFPNLVALVLLSPVVVHTTRDYFRRH